MEQVKHAIETGALRPGEQLPGIRPLAEELVINPNTVAKAYRELEHEGVIELRHGAGAFIAASSRPKRSTDNLRAGQTLVATTVERCARGTSPTTRSAGCSRPSCRAAPGSPGQEANVADALVVETSGLCKTYGKVRALRGLDLEVPAGSICGLLGRNGAGKTTAIKLLLGMARPTAGRARVFGLAADTEASSVEIRRRTGFVSAGPGQKSVALPLTFQHAGR
jgi:DNA-binding transcriptional regulator YhcF (GntR family)